MEALLVPRLRCTLFFFISPKMLAIFFLLFRLSFCYSGSVVRMVIFYALDVIADQVPASDNFADHEEGVGLRGDETGLEVLSLGDVLPGVDGTSVPEELEGGILGGLDLGSRGRSHALTNVDLFGNLACYLGIVQDRTCGKIFIVRNGLSYVSVFFAHTQKK